MDNFTTHTPLQRLKKRLRALVLEKRFPRDFFFSRRSSGSGSGMDIGTSYDGGFCFGELSRSLSIGQCDVEELVFVFFWQQRFEFEVGHTVATDVGAPLWLKVVERKRLAHDC